VPRLKQRSDGCYYILHHYRDCNTWQLDRDGVRFLERAARIGVDDHFQTDVLWKCGNADWFTSARIETILRTLRGKKGCITFIFDKSCSLPVRDRRTYDVLSDL
jgi:hypothetical protein